MRSVSLFVVALILYSISGLFYPVPIAAPAPHPQQVTVQADCVLPFVLTAVGSSQIYDNRGTGCYDWAITYTSYGFSTGTFAVFSAPNDISRPGTVGLFGGTSSTSQPVTVGSQGTYTLTGYYPYVGVELLTKTGTGSLQGTLYGRKRGVSTTAVSVDVGNIDADLDAIETDVDAIRTSVESTDPVSTNEEAGSPVTTRAVSGTVVTVIAASATTLLGCQCTNSHATAFAYAQIFDAVAGSVSLGTTTPTWTIGLPPNNQGLCPAPGLFVNGIAVAVTTTTNGSAGANPSAVCNWSYR